jgi:hypothetical protein
LLCFLSLFLVNNYWTDERKEEEWYMDGVSRGHVGLSLLWIFMVALPTGRARPALRGAGGRPHRAPRSQGSRSVKAIPSSFLNAAKVRETSPFTTEPKVASSSSLGRAPPT